MIESQLISEVRFQPILIDVDSWFDVSKNRRRIHFHAENLHDYPVSCLVSHIKLFFPLLNQSIPQLPFLTGKEAVWA